MIVLIIKLVLIAGFLYLQLYALVNWLKFRRSPDEEQTDHWQLVGWFFSFFLLLPYVLVCEAGGNPHNSDDSIMQWANWYDIAALSAMLGQAVFLIGALVVSAFRDGHDR